MDMKAEAKYMLEVTSDELFVIVKGLSKLAGEPDSSRSDVSYKLLDKLQSMMSFIERCEKAMDEAASPEIDPKTDRSTPLIAPGPPVPGPVMPPGDQTEAQDTSGEGKGAPRPPAPPIARSGTFRLPDSILPSGPPPQPPKRSSTKKASKKKGKS